jgi:hypothetical protein
MKKEIVKAEMLSDLERDETALTTKPVPHHKPRAESKKMLS